MKAESKGSLTGKKVVVLGGSSGIGFATAKAAAEKGAEVIIASSNQQRITDALKELPGNHTGYAADLTNEQEVQNLFNRIGKFDHLIFTAGENIQLWKLSDADIQSVRNYFNLRYFGAVTAVKYGTPYINDGGSIVLTGGIASLRPGSGWSMGASICAAMEGFTRAMAVELSPIRVNIVSPGVVRTNLWAGMSEEDREGMYKSIGDALPVKRIGEADDVAKAYLYLMEQQYTTGQTLVTDGGGILT